MTPTFILEENHDVPLCRIQITLRQGSALDQAGLGFPVGLANFASELMRRGAAGKTRATLDEQIDQLGASFTVSCGNDSITFDVISLKQNLPAACLILSEVILKPDFPQDEAQRLQRELLADLDEIRDDDQSLVSRFFSRALYSPHPYGNPIAGTEKSIPLLDEKQARSWYQSQVTLDNMIFGAAGDITQIELEQIFETYFSSLLDQPMSSPLKVAQSSMAKTAVSKNVGPNNTHPISHQVPASIQNTKFKVLLVDKPERTQSQILMGQLGPKWSAPDWVPLQIATTAFGGTFTSKLMEEVRVKRGLSYGTSASLGGGKDPQGLIVHVFPSAEQTKETIELILMLYEQWAASIQAKDILFAKDYLIKSHAFAIQTPESRLKRRTYLEVCGLPQEYTFTFPKHVANVTDTQVHQALEQTLRPRTLVITLVGTAKTLLPELKQIKAFQGVPIEVVSYDKPEEAE